MAREALRGGWAGARRACGDAEVADARCVLSLAPSFGLLVVFWGAQAQTATTLLNQACQLNL